MVLEIPLENGVWPDKRLKPRNAIFDSHFSIIFGLYKQKHISQIKQKAEGLAMTKSFQQYLF